MPRDNTQYTIASGKVQRRGLAGELQTDWADPKSVKVYHKERILRAGESRKKTWRKYMYKSLYGITQEQYDLMLEKQQGNCAICKRPPKPNAVLCVDHCHGTGKIRGLLCHSCNTSIGKLGGIDGLEAALVYLKEFYRRILSN